MEDHLKSAEKQIEQVNKTLVQLATGALALSITFKSSIAPENATWKWMLSLSWIFLALVPVSYIFIQLLSSQSDMFWHNNYLELETTISKGETPIPVDAKSGQIKLLTDSRIFLWKTMLFAFFLGIATLLTYAIKNN